MSLEEYMWKMVDQKPLGNTEGYGNFGLALSSLFFSQSTNNGEDGCAKVCRGWRCMCKHMLPIL